MRSTPMSFLWKKRCNIFRRAFLELNQTQLKIREEDWMVSPSKGNPEDHGRFPYSAIIDRKPLRWPNDARVAVWVIPNIEQFLFDRPSTSVTNAPTSLVPDVLNYSWRDYGVRVGIWRLMEIMNRHGFKDPVGCIWVFLTGYPKFSKEGNRLA